jgi:hypothetical protein
MAKRNTPAGMVAVGFQVISLSNSTAVGLNTTCIAAKVLHISVETQDVRYRADATAPTLTTGVLLQSDQMTWLFDVPTATLKFQRSTGTSKVSIMAYKYKGE